MRGNNAGVNSQASNHAGGNGLVFWDQTTRLRASWVGLRRSYVGLESKVRQMVATQRPRTDGGATRAERLAVVADTTLTPQSLDLHGQQTISVNKNGLNGGVRSEHFGSNPAAFNLVCFHDCLEFISSRLQRQHLEIHATRRRQFWLLAIPDDADSSQRASAR